MRMLKAMGLALCLLGALAWATGAYAQTLERGEIHGTTYDASHAPVPKAKVTLSNPSTGYQRTIVSGDDGSFDFLQIPAGVYVLTAEHENLATTKVTEIELNVGSSLVVDIAMPLKSQQQTVTVSATNAEVETPTAGVTQLLNAQSVNSLPFPGRDYRDMARLAPSASVVPGLRGGLRLGGQQSDYSGLVIDGADSTNNFFGEYFGSLETKNFTIPLEAVQEFEVITNGFAPEFGRATGGLLNVITKSGTNQVHGEGHYYYRGSSLTATDALGFAPNIDSQHQFGGSIGFPIHKDKQFLFLSADIQREHGPLATNFCSGPDQTDCQAALATATGPTFGPQMGTDQVPAACKGAVPGGSVLMSCYGVANLAQLEGSQNQFQNLASVLGHYDYQLSPVNHFSVRGFWTYNDTQGFTGGRGQNEVPIAFGDTEHFHNAGLSGVFALNSVFGQKVNEIRVTISGETRPRHPNSTAPEVTITDNSNPNFTIGADFGEHFFLPINNDNGKLQGQDNFSYSFGHHDMKWGGDVDTFVDRKDEFNGWSAGEYTFTALSQFNQPNPITVFPGSYAQGFGIGKAPLPAGTLFPNYQTGLGLYWQDKWQLKPRFTVTYGIRWDGTWNPQPQQPIPGQEVYVGVGPLGSGTRIAPVPQRVPNDFGQWGPRIGFAWNVGGTEHPWVIRAAWGFYYAQTPTIFMTDIFDLQTVTTCIFTCAPPGSGFPYLFPSTLPTNTNLCTLQTIQVGCPNINYADPALKNPRVSNLTAGFEHTIAQGWNVSATYVYVHSDHLRTGGFSTNVWSRNFVPMGTDQFGRAILAPYNATNCPTTVPPGDFLAPRMPLDCSINTANELGSFSRGNYNEFVAAVNKRFSHRYQFFASYTWSTNSDNASSERDTDTFFGPQDPFNINLDYGRSGLDVTHQFKAAGVIDLPFGFTWSSTLSAHSGFAYPAYNNTDTNLDFVINQFSFNDRPVVQTGSGKPFLLPRYPARQPGFFQWDTRINKDFKIGERYHAQLLADLFNLTNRGNLYSDPDVSGFVGPLLSSCTIGNQIMCPPLTAVPTPQNTPGYRILNQIANGSTPFAAQFGVRFQF
ncbi:MAG TPA: carboxypeptidase regulatory-like domain-containing protein [Candidatus Acidoferrales bacterium]|nr:carboxypeptidase regulatory-like domain-containing protein [Candidatus Acidoferrales bacterium]